MNKIRSVTTKYKNKLIRSDYLYKSESGQLGPIFIFFMGVVLIGFYYVILSPLMYDFTEVHQDMQDSGTYPIPTDKIEAMIMLQFAWKAIPVVSLLILFVWLISKSLRENSGEV